MKMLARTGDGCPCRTLILFLRSRKTPITFLILPLVKPTNSFAASSRNRGNYQHIGNPRFLPNGKGIASLAHSTELNAFLPILRKTLKL